MKPINNIIYSKNYGERIINTLERKCESVRVIIRSALCVGELKEKGRDK